MIAFVIHVNGKRVRAIGVAQEDDLTAELRWCGGPCEGEARLSLLLAGAIRGADGGLTGELLMWLAAGEASGPLRVGDRVTIEVVEAGSVDPPDMRELPDPDVPF